MSLIVFYKLAAIFITVALGWFAGRMRWLGPATVEMDPARMLSNVAFFIFIPALMFRTTARIDLQALPWTTLLAFFAPALGLMVAVYAVQRWRLPAPAARQAQAQAAAPAAHQAQAAVPTAVGSRAAPAAATAVDEAHAAIPAVRAFAVTFGNSVQIGIPLSAALFGEAGLGLHITLVSLHALALMSLATVLVELDIGRARAAHSGRSQLWSTLRATARSTVVHPVVLPVLAGLAWNLTGLGLPGAVDETLQLLSTAVAPLCLVMIGLSLAYYGLGGALLSALSISLLKLLVLPALVLGVAHWGFGLTGVPLQVVVLMAALPSGSNPLIFAQRYRTQESQTTAAIVLSTLGFVFTAPLWLALLAQIA